ncbi:T9SS type A sorting domain-containing protein [Hymenobacter sp. B1770]|uniref:T9SS type A sorting domain-containing protein n=1 Tax=Hymenobacter sp. B1770 TaxID=1718788 RepID=UPI003CF0B630
MTTFYKKNSRIKEWSTFLAFLFIMGVQQSWGQTLPAPYPVASGTYREAFAGISTWTNGFASGTGANRFGVASPDPVLPNTNIVFVSGTSGGVQRGTEAIVLLATGTDGTNASAFDLYLDFAGTTAGTISFDWAAVPNSTGNRQSTFKLQTSTGPNAAFVDVKETAIVITNNQASAGRLAVALPAEFNNNPSARVRFYIAATAGGVSPTGSRPKISIDNLEVNSTGTDGPATPFITTGAVSPTSFCVTSSAPSSAFNVAYTSTGTLTGTYKVQLSDANGVFANSTTAGIIGSGSNSPLSAIIPAGTPSGSKYRLRVLNDAPATYGSNNGADLTVGQTLTENPVTVAPNAAQSVLRDGSGATLTASAAAGSTYVWKYGTSAAGPFSSAIAGATSAAHQLKGADFPSTGTYFLVAQATASSACGTATGESAPIEITVTAPVVTPALTVSTTALPDFNNVPVGAGSPLKSFTVSGTSLTDNIVITPPAGFEIRTGINPFACCTIELSPVGGNVPSTTIEVRFAPTVAQSIQATIPVTTPGFPNEEVAVSGTGIAAVFPATLATTAVTDLTATAATTGGTVATDGGSAITARGVVWSKTENPALGNTTSASTTDGTGTGVFSSAITDLLPGTTYFVRAYATSAVSTAYGEELTFTTVEVPLAAEPTASGTIAATEVTGTSMQLNLTGGNGTKYLVVARLGSPVDVLPTDATTYPADAEFGKSKSLGGGQFVVHNGTATTVALTGLRPNSPYHFAVFAFNDNNGTIYAENYLTTNPGTLTQNTEALPATLLLEENFDYASGALLVDNNWKAHSGAGTQSIAVTSTGLSYAGYGPNSGHAARMSGSGEDVNRTFEAVYARTPVYASFLVNVSSVNATGDYFFLLGPKAIGSTFRSRVHVRRDAATGKLQFGIASGTGTVSYTAAAYDVAATHLVVVKYTFDEASSEARIFINPTTDTEPVVATATAAETSNTPSAPNDNIGAVALRQGGSSAPTLLVDGIRIGNTYKAVRTGVTCEPAVLAALSNKTATAPADRCDASVAFAATAAVDPEPTITYSILKNGLATAITSPYLFPVGITTVTATATNRCGTDAQTFTVTVEDKEAPIALTRNVTVALANGTVTITAAQVDNGSTDACGIVSLALSKSTFSCDNIGENTVTLTVTDTHGNMATETGIVTVTGTIPTPTIAVKPSSTVFTGGVATNLYIGYGPQSVTLTASGGVSYQWSPVEGLSNTSSASSVFTATTAGTFVCTVRATSASGCTATQSVTLVVRDVRCGNNDNDKNPKVLICHRGKPQCVSSKEVPSYLKQGDTLGDCSISATNTSAAATGLPGDNASSAAKASLPAANAPVFEAYPNPFTERTVVHFRAGSTGPAQLQLYNSLGQVVKTFYSGTAVEGQDYEFTLEGATLAAGVYTGRLLVDGKMQTLRVVLTK